MITARRPLKRPRPPKIPSPKPPLFKRLKIGVWYADFTRRSTPKINIGIVVVLQSF
nr:MAG TPA: hypothetical protein [Caudoviricetes sp.]